MEENHQLPQMNGQAITNDDHILPSQIKELHNQIRTYQTEALLVKTTVKMMVKILEIQKVAQMTLVCFQIDLPCCLLVGQLCLRVRNHILVTTVNFTCLKPFTMDRQQLMVSFIDLEQPQDFHCLVRIDLFLLVFLSFVLIAQGSQNLP